MADIKLGLGSLSNIYKGVSQVDKVYLGTTLVYSVAVAPPSPPTISDYSAIRTSPFDEVVVAWKVTNQDDIAQYIFSDANDTSPNANRQTLASGGISPEIGASLSSATTVTVYAYVGDNDGTTVKSTITARSVSITDV